MRNLWIAVVGLVAIASWVLPALLVLERHVVQLEIRTAILCPNGLPKPEPVQIGPDGCAR